tara:strand:+ start:2617 stop:3183 length:567 start_codon:yes stop_codon:yes gene_type:complete
MCLGDSGKKEQERQIKVIFSIEQNEKSNTIEPFYKILDLVFKFDLRDNPNGGTYSLLEAAYLKLIQENGTPLTEGDHISARRLSRAFPIVCVMSFLDSVDFNADLRDQFIEAVGESKLGELKPQLIDGSYVRTYKYCSEILAANNDDQDIRSIIESIGSVRKANLKSEESFSENELKKMIGCLKEELL